MQHIEVTAYELTHGTPADPSAQIEGFRFGRPMKFFGPVPTKLYDSLRELEELDAGGVSALTSASVDDLRYVWRRLGYAKEAGCNTRRTSLTWNDDAATMTDADLEAVREVLERHHPKWFTAPAAPTSQM